MAAIAPVHLAVAQTASPDAGNAATRDEPAWYERLLRGSDHDRGQRRL